MPRPGWLERQMTKAKEEIATWPAWMRRDCGFGEKAMSVLACDRVGCERVMCDTLVDNCYVCEDCVQEFRESVGEEPIPRRAMLQRFRAFMKTRKIVERGEEIIDVDRFLRVNES